MLTSKSNRGFSLISSVVAVALTASALLAYVGARNLSAKKQNLIRESMVARLYALELLEVFRSYDNGGALVDGYLKKNIPPTFTSGYNLCDSINVFDRSALTTTHPDPMADLDANPLDQGSPAMNAHRSYQIQLIDATTMEILNPPECSSAPTNVNALATNTLMGISVWVSWIPKGESIANEQVVQLNTVLPVLGRTPPATGNTF